MKLSQAILLGSTMVAAKPGGQYFSETKSGCALGMAAVANGCSFRRTTQPVNANERRTLGAEGVWGQWVLRVVTRPCDCWILRMPRKMRIKDLIAHLFDVHVMKKKNWTLNQLAAWVQTWEPEEVSPMPIVKAIDPGRALARQQIVRQRLAEQEWQRVAEQEWQQVRQAFETRHQARRASPGNPSRETTRAGGSDEDKALLS
jgi:hypothetical protein